MNEKEKYLTEQLGECVPVWYNYRAWNGVDYNEYAQCIKCKKYEYEHKLLNKFQQADEANKFFILWNWAKKQDWWDDFVYNNLPVGHSAVEYEKFSDILYKFLREDTTL